MAEVVGLEPFPLESLTSLIRRAARGRFFTDTVSFLRASGVDWNKRTRDADLIRDPVLEQVASALGLEVDRAGADRPPVPRSATGAGPRQPAMVDNFVF